MTSRADVRRTLTGLAIMAAIGLTGGCGSSDNSTDSGPDATAESTSPTPVRVPESTPTVEPADGPLLKTDAASVRALKGMHQVSDWGVLQSYRNDQAGVAILPGYAGDASLDEFARRLIKDQRSMGEKIRRLDDVVVAGKYNALHYVSKDFDNGREDVHTIGVRFLEGSWLIIISFYNQSITPGIEPLTNEERDEVIASVLATFEVEFN